MSTKAAENNNLVPAQPKTKDEGTPENNAKIHVHDATEKTEDIKPKQVGPENAKEILTGALAQKVSEFNTRFKKKAEFNLGKAVAPLFVKEHTRLPGELPKGTPMAEMSETARPRQHFVPDISPMFNNFMPHVARAAGTALGGQTGGDVASTANRVWLAHKNIGHEGYEQREHARRLNLDSRSQRYNEAINEIKTRPSPPPTLPAGQPRPPVVQPPRGTGSSLLNKKADDSMVPAAKPTVNDIHMGGFAAGTGTVGAALGGAAGGTLGGLAGLIDPGTYEENGVKKRRGRLMGGLMGAGKGALGGAVGGGAVGGLGGAGLLQMLRNMENARTAPKTAALNDYGSIGGGAMVGGLGGAALGGLAGLISPGQETEYDNYGRPVGSKQRSRLGAALRGALGGGAIGGLGGAAAGHFMPGQTNQALAALQPYLNSAQEYGKGMYNKMFPQKDNIAVPKGYKAVRDEAGAPITVVPNPNVRPAPAGADNYVGEGGGTSAPMLPPNAAVTGPVAKKPGQFDNFFRNMANGATAGAW